MLINFKKLQERGFIVEQVKEGLEIIPNRPYAVSVNLDEYDLNAIQKIAVIEGLSNEIQKFQILNALDP